MSKEKPAATPSNKAPEDTPSTTQRTKKDHRNLIIIVLLILTLFSLGAAAYLYYQNTQLQSDIDDQDIQITSLNAQITKLQNDQESEKEVLYDESINEDNQSDEVVENDTPQDLVEDELGKYILYNRKIVEIEEISTVPGWDVVRTFEIEDQVEKLMVNQSETYFVYGVYSGDSALGDDGPQEYWYDWYAYEIETGKTTKITGRKFEPLNVEGFEAETNRVWGWISDNEVLTGDDGMMVINGAAIYNVDTGELRVISEEEWFSYRDKL